MPTQHQPNAAMKLVASALAVLLLASCCPPPNKEAIVECSQKGGVFTYSCESFTPWKASMSVACNQSCQK